MKPHPPWALKHKTKGTELRLLNGKYYLYRVSSVWDKQKKRARKITHEMVGRITEKEGLIPKGTKKPTRLQQVWQKTSVKEYGATWALKEIGQDIWKALERGFPSQAKKLWTLAVHRLLYQAPLKNMSFLYEESFLSEQWPDLKLSRNELTILMEEIGRNQDAITCFLQTFIEGSQHLVFDVTHMISQMTAGKMNQKGYNSLHQFDPQVNLFYMFSVDKQLPVYYRVFPGNIHGLRAVQLSIREARLKKAIVIGDKGLVSKSNIEFLQSSPLRYILPLKRDHADIDYSRLNSRDYGQAFEGHFFYHHRVIFYYPLSLSNGQKAFVFLDPQLRLAEETAYLRRIEQRREDCDLDRYKQKQLSLGTFTLLTNIPKSTAQQLYEHYKSRMEVEAVFDTYKNLLHADRPYMHSDVSIHAWVFINHLATLLYYKVLNLLKQHDWLSRFSPRDLFMHLSRVTQLKIHSQWYLSEINSKSQKLFASLDLHIT